MSMKIRIISAEDVQQLLPMGEAIHVMRAAFAQLSAGRAVLPQRLCMDTKRGTSLMMPAYLEHTGDCCIKVVSVYDDNPSLGLPAVTGVVAVLDAETGLPRALLDAHQLTLIRTGATGGLAADLLARTDAETVAVIGAGEQGLAQLQGVLEVRRIRHVYVIDRSSSAAAKFVVEVANWPDPPALEVMDEPREAVRKADIVITATNSGTPVFDGRDLAPGTHLTGMGSYKPQTREVDEVAVKRSRVIVDCREAASVEAGDLIMAGVTDFVELGEVINGKEPARRNDDEITFFKTVGVAVQDAAASRVVVDKAEQSGLGTVVCL